MAKGRRVSAHSDTGVGHKSTQTAEGGSQGAESGAKLFDGQAQFVTDDISEPTNEPPVPIQSDSGDNVGQSEPEVTNGPESTEPVARRYKDWVSGPLICPKCGLNERAFGMRWCRACRAAYMRANRPKYSELSEEERRRSCCRSYTHTLIKRGQLQREPCIRCGSPYAQAHHPDYSDPRNIVWMCRECHLLLHGVLFGGHL